MKRLFCGDTIIIDGKIFTITGCQYSHYWDYEYKYTAKTCIDKIKYEYDFYLDKKQNIVVFHRLEYLTNDVL